MSAPLGQSIVEVLEKKGWHLYKALPTADFADIVRQGKTTRIEQNVPYVMLPVASQDTDVDDVGTHAVNARHTNQLPTYRDEKHPASQVELIRITEYGLDIKVSKEAGVYRIETRDVENIIKFNLSNYNRYFFPNIDELADFFLHRGIREQTPSSLPGQLRWELVDTNPPSDRVLIHPSNPSPFLFRGESKQYSKCYPTVFRDVTTAARTFRELPEITQAIVALNLIRTQWFSENLKQTPARRWMSSQKIVFDDVAMAQHYGLPTSYIDLSQSFEVASFFACCEYDCVNRVWRPVEDGKGTIYVVDIRHPACGTVKPIDLEAFPRPNEQWAWVYEVGMRDFGMLPDVRKFTFEHNAVASQKILDRFRGGADLFPSDSLSKLADTIKLSNSIPRVVAEEVKWSKSIPNAVMEKGGDEAIRDALGVLGGDVQAVLAKIEELVNDITFSKSQAPFVVTEVMMEDMDAVWARCEWGKTWSRDRGS